MRSSWGDASWNPGGSRRALLGLVVALHAAAVLAWWQLPLSHMALVAPPRIVSVAIGAQATQRSAEAPPPAPRRPPPPKPRAVAPRPAHAASDEVATFEPMPPSAPAIAPSRVPMASAPVVVASAPAVSTPAPAATPVPLPVVPPRFDVAYLDNAPPAYPSLSRQFREQGVVMLHVRVTQAGVPDAVDIRESSGSPRLDEAARTAVMRWRFVPARQGDTAVAAWVVVPVRFALNG